MVRSSKNEPALLPDVEQTFSLDLDHLLRRRFRIMVTAKSADHMGFYAVILTAPTVAILFFTYRTYLKNVESAAAQADQAKQHVEELSHYIAEQGRIREQFSQIEKLSALGELASGVAHDFNNTLAGILGRAQLLTRTNDPEKIKRGLEIIIKAAEDGANTVKGFRTSRGNERTRISSW